MFKAKTATILAATALVVAAFGSTPLGHAAGNLILAKNSVGAAQLKKNAVTGPKVKNGTLLAVDFKRGQLPAGPQGIKGDKGDPGAPGLKGDKGDPGATTVTRHTALGPPAGAGGYSNAIAYCQAGETLVGGGAVSNSPPPGLPTVTWSGPDPNSTNGWRASFRNDGVGTVTAFAYALCAKP
jgi:hypothetical protein